MSPSSSLPIPTPHILATVRRFKMASASQLRVLHYQGTERGIQVRSSYHLNRLYELGKLRRMWGIHQTRPAQYVYFPPGTTGKPNDHRLDVLELYVRIFKLVGEVPYDPAPYGHKKLGHISLEPDASLDMGGKRKFFIEIDEDQEHKPELRRKMRHYISAFEAWDGKRDGEVFPVVVWVVPNEARARDMWDCIREQTIPQLFTVMLFDEAPARLAKG